MSIEQSKYLEYDSLSHSGLKEEHNQDYAAVYKTINGTIFVVCGGIKERRATSIASKIAAKSVGEYFKNKKYNNLQKALYNSILYANQQIFEQAQKNSNYKNMATTIVVALIHDNQLYYAYVGNSRLYFLKGSKLQRLTKDHVKEQQLVNALGKDMDFRFSICKQPLTLNDDDLLLLCSDGLSSQLTDKDIYNALTEEDISVKHQTAKLIDIANIKGGNDNVSVQLVRYDSKIPSEPVRKRKMKKINPLFVIIPVAIIIAGFGIYYLIIKDVPQKFFSYIKDSFKKTEIVTSDTVSGTLDITTDSSLYIDSSIINENSLLHDTIINYKVKMDENLYRISLHFNIPVESLAKINNIKPESLYEGQRINIPIKGVYTIVKDDLIYQIAKRLEVDYKDIIEANKLNTYDYLTEGDILYIPYGKNQYKGINN